MADEPDQPDAIVNLTAELRGAMWTLYGIPVSGGERQTIGSGPVGSGISFPVKLLDRLSSEAS